MILVHNKIEQCTTELTKQSSSCPSTLTRLELIDKRLHEFIHLHHIDLIRQIKYHVSKLKDNIHEKQLLRQLSSYNLTTQQVLFLISILHRLLFPFVFTLL